MIGIWVFSKKKAQREMVVRDRLTWALQLNPAVAFVLVLLIGVVVFCICSLLEQGRMRLFKKIGI